MVHHTFICEYKIIYYTIWFTKFRNISPLAFCFPCLAMHIIWLVGSLPSVNLFNIFHVQYVLFISNHDIYIYIYIYRIFNLFSLILLGSQLFDIIWSVGPLTLYSYLFNQNSSHARARIDKIKEIYNFASLIYVGFLAIWWYDPPIHWQVNRVS
jgi:hypothetical protein